jgi:hypothetical protein
MKRHQAQNIHLDTTTTEQCHPKFMSLSYRSLDSGMRALGVLLLLAVFLVSAHAAREYRIVPG